MGEAPALFVDYLQNGCGLKYNCCQTATVIGNKRYLIGKTVGESTMSIDVRIYDECRQEWVIPTVLGKKPEQCNGHSAVSLNGDRILIIRKDSLPADSIWILEVDSKYVRDQKKVLETEVVAWSKGVIGDTEKPIVISGPSGVGKGTLISMLMKEFPSMFGFSVSHTTRAPRGMEHNGVHYHFTDRIVMEKDIKDGKFLEFALVHGNLYGTSIEAVEAVADAGKRCILDIDVQGARSVRASSLEATFIFICPPSMEELEKRLRSRGTEAEEQVLKRLRNAEEEIEQGKSPGIFDNFLYNDNLDECYKNLKKLLGLDGTTTPTHRPSKGVDLPLNHTVLKADNKILIPGSENASKNLIVLDVSLLIGGAPGRTRGLDIFSVYSSSDCLNEIIQLS